MKIARLSVFTTACLSVVMACSFDLPLIAQHRSETDNAPSGPNIVTLSMDVTLDQVAEEDAKMYRVGGHDLDRIAYDKTKVDPMTHKVPINYLAHYIGGHWTSTTPTEASSLDLSSVPYKLDFVASVTHGRPIVVLFETESQHMVILSRPDFRSLIAGKYTIDSTPLSPAQIVAPPPNANSPDTMPMMSGMPAMPNAPGAGPEPPPAPAGAASGVKLTTNSTYGDLLANPASKQVLTELIPEVVNNPQSQLAAELPLRELSQYEPTLTPAKLKQIDERLLKLSTPK